MPRGWGRRGSAGWGSAKSGYEQWASCGQARREFARDRQRLAMQFLVGGRVPGGERQSAPNLLVERNQRTLEDCTDIVVDHLGRQLGAIAELRPAVVSRKQRHRELSQRVDDGLSRWRSPHPPAIANTMQHLAVPPQPGHYRTDSRFP